MSDDRDDKSNGSTKGGLTRREWFKGIGGGALATGLLGRSALGPGEAQAAEAGLDVLGPGAVKISILINGEARTALVEPRVTLLALLRDRLDLTGAKEVCDRGSCGACTVLLDDVPVNACMVLAVEAAGRKVLTVEGLAKDGALTPLQRAFVEHDALQCGFCTPGMVMSCTALLSRNAKPSIDDVKRAVAGNLCRCGTYPKVFEAVLAASGQSPGSGKKGA